MRRLRRRDFLRASLLAAAGGAVAACSPGAPVTDSVEAADLANEATVFLEFWNPASDPTGSKTIGGLVDDFNRTIGHKHRIYVNNRIKAIPQSGGYVQYTTAMTSSGSPDVVMTYEYTPVTNWAAYGFLKPLDQYMTSGMANEFFPIAWSMIHFNGHLWGLLQEFDFNQLWWNKAIHRGGPPRTIDELDSFAKEYTKISSSGVMTQAPLIPWDAGTDWNPLFGGSYYDVGKGVWTITNPDNEAMLEWFAKYVRIFGGRNRSDALESSIPKQYGDIFQYGKVAFAMEGEYTGPELKLEGIKLDYGVTHLPTVPGVPWGTAQTDGGNVFVLPTRSPHPDEAFIFLSYMGGNAGVRQWCVGASNNPPVRATAFAPSFLKELPWMKPWIENLNLDHMVPPIPSPNLSLFSQLIGNAVDEVTYGKATPKQALAQVESQIATAVKQFRVFNPGWPGE